MFVLVDLHCAIAYFKVRDYDKNKNRINSAFKGKTFEFMCPSLKVLHS